MSTSALDDRTHISFVIRSWRYVVALPKYGANVSIELRRQSSLLRWLLLSSIVIAAISVVTLVVMSFVGETQVNQVGLCIASLLTFSGAFGFNRAGHYRLAAWLTLGVFWLAPNISAFINTTGSIPLQSIYWVASLSIMLTGILQPNRLLVLASGLTNIVSVLVVNRLLAEQQPNDLYSPIVGIGLMTVWTVVVHEHRRHLENERQAALVVANTDLEFQMGERQRLASGLTSILNAADDLLMVPDIDTLWKRGVELACERLNIERCGIYQYVAATGELIGTYGVDMSGVLISEHAKCITFSEVPWVADALANRSERGWTVELNADLYDFRGGVNKVATRGWSILTPISSGDGWPSAVLINDSAITGHSYDPLNQDLLRIFCTLLGGILERKRAEAQRDERQAALQTANELLNRQMKDRERLTNGLTAILSMADELMTAPDLDMLWRRGVELVCERLDVVRCSIFEYDTATGDMVGTYRTGVSGETVDERTNRFKFAETPFGQASRLRPSGQGWMVEHDAELLDFVNGERILLGKGWVATTLISTHKGLPFAILFNDPGPTGKLFDSLGQDLIGLYCSLLGGIVERKRAEAKLEENVMELRVAKRMADEGSRVKSEFLATVSHELRTPLNAIIGFSDMLLMGMNGELNPKQRHKMDRLRDNGVRLLTLINNVLDLTRLEARRIEISNKPFSPQDLAKRISAQMEVLAQQKGIEFNTQVDLAMPATLLGDEQRIEQVVINLLSNAFKFTSQGSVTLNVTIQLNKNIWMIRVADTGIGIPPHALNMIFEEFRQVDGSYSRTFKGSGLGLAITRNLIRLMNGQILVNSEMGKGSVFTVTLPILSEPLLQNEFATGDQSVKFIKLETQ